MSILASVEHVFAAAITNAKKAAKVIQSQVLPALVPLHADAGTIAAVSGLIDPRLANVEMVADALLGAAIKAVQDGTLAGNANGANITLDSALIADIKTLVPMVTALAAPQTALAPATAK